MASAASQPGEADQTEATEAPDGAESPQEDIRSRFRDALDRKQHKNADRHGDGGGKDTAKVHDTHNVTQKRREFRRKSG